MRIDFGASYKEVSKLLRAPAKPGDKLSGEEFASRLAKASKPEQSTADNSAKTRSSEHIPRTEVNDTLDIRAGLKLSESHLELPAIPQITPEETQKQDPISETDGIKGSVKTPTMFEVRRVALAGDSKPTTQTPSLDREGIKAMLRDVGTQMGVSPQLSMAVVTAESAFNPLAVSSDGHASKGLFQLLDTTGKDLLSRGVEPGRAYDPFNPQLNVELGTSYLKYLHNIFGTETTLPNKLSTTPAANAESREKFAVAAFNAGEGRVASAQQRAEKIGKDPSLYDHVERFLPKSTQQYVTKVISSKNTQN